MGTLKARTKLPIQNPAASAQARQTTAEFVQSHLPTPTETPDPTAAATETSPGTPNIPTQLNQAIQFGHQLGQLQAKPQLQSSTLGNTLPSAIEHKMESAFGTNFAQVRIHENSKPQAYGAAAYTQGSDIHFVPGQYNPFSHKGQRLLAHELTHVAQQQISAPPAGTSLKAVSQRRDNAEQEAETLAERAVAGQSVQVSAAPSAQVHCGFLDWAEEKVSGAADWASDTASSAWDGVSDAASNATDWASDTASSAWDGVSGAASNASDWASDSAASAWDGISETGSDIYAGMQQGSEYIKQGEAWFGDKVDWLQGNMAGGAQWLADKADGIPVLEQLADAGAWGVDQATQVSAGAWKGLGSMAGGLANIVVNPVDTGKGLFTLAEHMPTLPGIVNPFKAAHGVYDVAFNDADLGDTADRIFNPVRSMEESMAFGQTFASGIAAPYKEAIDQGRYGEVLGRGLFDIGSLLLGGSGALAKGGGTAGKVGSVADDAGRVGGLADDAGRAGSVADDAGRAGSTASSADTAGDTGRAANTVKETPKTPSKPSGQNTNTNKKGGGKTGRKQNPDRSKAWQDKVAELEEQLKHAKTKKEKAEIKRKLKHARMKAAQKSENHAQKGQGY